MVDRRNFITGVSAIGALQALNSPAAAINNTSINDTLDMLTPSEPLIGPRMNLVKAYEVMEELGLDALLLSEGINVYHATGEWPISTRMGLSPSIFVIVSRRRDQPISMVMPSFAYYYQVSDMGASDNFAVYQYTSPGRPADGGGLPEEAAPVNVFPDREITSLDSIEKNRADLTRLAAQKYGASSGEKTALLKAFKDLGLTSASVAVDSAAARLLVESASPKTEVFNADLALRKIRPVKSDIEINLMRRAATSNAEAALAAVKTVREGATYRELRNTFYVEAAKRENTGVFMVVDRVSADNFDAPFRNGQSFLIDAVSKYNGYHGDYGRTVFIEEPSKFMAQVTKTIGLAWDEVRNALKPGMKFSEIRELGKSTIKKLGGGSYIVSFTPHSVGLYHTDHIGHSGEAATREDMVLEKGMIISVDCPLLEAGIGGSAHLEDLMLITADGSEPLNSVGEQTIIV